MLEKDRRKNHLWQWASTEKDHKVRTWLNAGQVKASAKTDRKSNPLGPIIDLVQVSQSESSKQWTKLVSKNKTTGMPGCLSW